MSHVQSQRKKGLLSTDQNCTVRTLSLQIHKHRIRDFTMMKQYPSGLPDSGWMKPAVVFVDNNDRYVRQWLTDCEKYSVHSVNSETGAPSSVSSHIYCEVEDADLKSETEIQRWSTWRTRVNEQLINNVLVVEQPEVESDAKENVPSSASCYQEASKSMRRSSTDLSLPDFTVYGIPRARLGK